LSRKLGSTAAIAVHTNLNIVPRRTAGNLRVVEPKDWEALRRGLMVGIRVDSSSSFKSDLGPPYTAADSLSIFSSGKNSSGGFAITSALRRRFQIRRLVLVCADSVPRRREPPRGLRAPPCLAVASRWMTKAPAPSVQGWADTIRSKTQSTVAVRFVRMAVISPYPFGRVFLLKSPRGFVESTRRPTRWQSESAKVFQFSPCSFLHLRRNPGKQKIREFDL
jgi:hypothetical protein